MASLLKQIQPQGSFTIDDIEYYPTVSIMEPQDPWKYQPQFRNCEILNGRWAEWENLTTYSFHSERAASTEIVQRSIVNRGKAMTGDFYDLLEWWPFLSIAGRYKSLVTIREPEHQELQMYHVLALGEEFGANSQGFVVVEDRDEWQGFKTFPAEAIIQVVVIETATHVEFPIVWKAYRNFTHPLKVLEVYGDMYIPTTPSETTETWCMWNQSISLKVERIQGEEVTISGPLINWSSWARQSSDSAEDFGRALIQASVEGSNVRSALRNYH